MIYDTFLIKRDRSLPGKTHVDTKVNVWILNRQSLMMN